MTINTRRTRIAHVCREHIIVQHGPNGGSPKFRCSVCRKPIVLKLLASEVLARVSP
jgi:hypothetical protein